MGDVSQNFSKAEFACKCCGQVHVEAKLVAGLQALRERIGKPIHINSGYRCPKHNAAVGGVPKSQHPLGKAADIHVKGMAMADLYRQAEAIPQFAGGGIGLYPDRNFVHVDVRGFATRWAQLGGKYVAVERALHWKDEAR
ncbi:MAG: YcbK family protein [Armatimonadota bacterium]